jgi:hypothetical protein
MALTAAQAEAAEWSDTRGEDWEREWTRTTGSSTYDNASLLIQLRDGRTEDAVLVATSVTAEGVTANISTTGTDLEAATPVLKWSIPKAVTATIEPGDYWIEAQCEVNGLLKVIMRHKWTVRARVAVEVAP